MVLGEEAAAAGGDGGGAAKEKTLEEITLEMLEQLGAAVRPSRHVPNLEALNWVVGKLHSAEPPTELDMEWCSVGDEQAAVLAKALKGNTTVHTLKLRYNEIRDQGATALAESLEGHASLHTVTLGNNLIGDAGAQRLASAIGAPGGKVQRLDLRYNAMGPTLPESFVSLTGLTALDISANRLVALPPQVGQLTGLQELVVSRNHNLLPRTLCSITDTEELLRAIREQAPAGQPPQGGQSKAPE
ncbi:hypothetical protein T484DRAFT_1973874 [Baffinella frigidus]|nr:hypothetical protein T484DRAFT_1973874 [Cryptophyta sp. CCMP2293]